VLDSFAWLAYLRAEPGGTHVLELLNRIYEGDDDVEAFMSLINLGEVLYAIEREDGPGLAVSALAELDNSPIQLAEVTRSRVLAAAHLKANYRISYADAFAAALCQERNATLLTGDPEFRTLENQIKIEWLPQR
jgi:ribonuclease VapC